jgi:hypothetical protein
VVQLRASLERLDPRQPSKAAANASGTMSAGVVFELSSGSLDLNGTLAVTAPVSRTGRDSPPLNPLRFIMIC